VPDLRLKLPPGVSVQKQQLASRWIYLFRHQVLGELGRMVLQETADGRTHISCEVVGDRLDPMTVQRATIFEPLSRELTRRMEVATGPTTDASCTDSPPPSVPAPREVIESKLIPCERCGAMVAMLIFAPAATDAGRFEDYARKMYPEYTRLNLPTWIIGPALGSGQLMERPADFLKIWPAREAIRRWRPAEFNPIVDRLADEHCGDARAGSN